MFPNTYSLIKKPLKSMKLIAKYKKVTVVDKKALKGIYLEYKEILVF